MLLLALLSALFPQTCLTCPLLLSLKDQCSLTSRGEAGPRHQGRILVSPMSAGCYCARRDCRFCRVVATPHHFGPSPARSLARPPTTISTRQPRQLLSLATCAAKQPASLLHDSSVLRPHKKYLVRLELSCSRSSLSLTYDTVPAAARPTEAAVTDKHYSPT